jgi:hypothetical protein
MINMLLMSNRYMIIAAKEMSQVNDKEAAAICFQVKDTFRIFLYRWTSLPAVFLSANSLINVSKIGLKCQIPSQNVSFYLRIQYSRSKIVGRIYRE